MSLHIIIDGYNLIHQSEAFNMIDTGDIEGARNALIDALAAYKRYKHHKITVVFDGWNAPVGSDKTDRRQGIQIRFSSNGEIADNVIKRLVRKEREKALVVSSDREVMSFAEAQGAATSNSPLFQQRLHLAARDLPWDAESKDRSGWIPTTKKKGPSRRLPRRQRRNRVKVNKL